MAGGGNSAVDQLLEGGGGTAGLVVQDVRVDAQGDGRVGVNRPGLVEGRDLFREAGVMPAPRKYSAELRERAVRIVEFAVSAHGLERLAAVGGKKCPVVRDQDLQLLSFA